MCELLSMRCEKKVWRVNEFPFPTPKRGKCHLVFLNQITSNFEPRLSWLVRNSKSPRAAQKASGEGTQRLRGRWKSQPHRGGEREAASAVLRDTAPRPRAARALLCTTPGSHQLLFLPISSPAWDCPTVEGFPPTCPLGKTFHLLPRWVPTDTTVDVLFCSFHFL